MRRLIGYAGLDHFLRGVSRLLFVEVVAEKYPVPLTIIPPVWHAGGAPTADVYIGFSTTPPNLGE